MLRTGERPMRNEASSMIVVMLAVLIAIIALRFRPA